ncbi:MAG: hypothetical protein ACRDNG_04820 [Gaiellaceae bacterium]
MASAKRNAEAMLRAKEAKQKKLLFVLVPVFLGLAVWQGPKMFGQLFGGSKPTEAAPVTTAAPTGSVPAAPGTTPPATPAGVLADTDVPPEANPSKLISFSRFTGRDPFASPYPSAGSPPTTPTPTTPASPGGGGGGTEEQQLTAVIETNGVSETVSVGEEFPAADPTFTLVALTLEGATVGVVQGMFETGEATIEIEVGEEVTLIAAPETTQYVVKLVDVMN